VEPTLLEEEGGEAVTPASRGDPHALLAQLAAELDEVEAALRRLDEGTYGRCEACGGPVPPEHLRSWPTARRCPSCP